MPDNPLNDPLREVIWRRPFTAAEEAQLRTRLQARPDDQKGWEADLELTAALRKLPDALVPSNFTARVLREVERESPAASRTPLLRVWFAGINRWLPRLAVACLIVGAGMLSWSHARATRHAEIVHSVAAMSGVSSLPTEILKDFDAIQALDRAPAADEQLLTLLQ